MLLLKKIKFIFFTLLTCEYYDLKFARISDIILKRIYLMYCALIFAYQVLVGWFGILYYIDIVLMRCTFEFLFSFEFTLRIILLIINVLTEVLFGFDIT